ncbi:MAG: DegT/DnrJ/EryC1/StrS family aminotransferase, partial [Actinomycetia bacterium]|nr:DegT/DnrJ/EryC1/StrS family aminotransferase [Actinomycetes bacterium]
LSMGPRLEMFENEMAKYTGRKYAVGVNSGTSGLHLSVRALGIQEGDEVITTPFSFIASANCILFEKAKPVFVDIDEESFNINPHLIEEKITKKTKAVLPVHVFGVPCSMDNILQLSKKYRLKIIEDACEAIGAKFKKKKVGSFGDTSVFAFYPNKQIATGEGGMVLVDNKQQAKIIRSMRNQGRGSGKSGFDHIRLGYNYRLDEMSAALGLMQLRRIEEINEKRKEVALKLNESLSGIEELELPYNPSESERSWFVYIVRFSEEVNRDEIPDYLRLKGVQTRPYFSPIHLTKFYRKKFGYCEKSFPIAEKVSKATLALPFFNQLSDKEIAYITVALKKAIVKLKKS